LSWIKVEEDDLFCLGRMHEDNRQARRIYELLGMKPLHFAELKDRVCIVVGKRRWIDKDSLKKVEEFTKKEIVVLRKGEEEGLLIALYNGESKFLGIGVLREIDYSRKALKIFTPVSKEISTVFFGKVKLDKTLKEIPLLAEETTETLFSP
jgi:polynucleotide 5'-kinase involved in rRNA processing